MVTTIITDRLAVSLLRAFNLHASYTAWVAKTAGFQYRDFLDNNHLRLECSPNHYHVGLKITRRLVNVEQFNGKQRAFAIKSFYSNGIMRFKKS